MLVAVLTVAVDVVKLLNDGGTEQQEVVHVQTSQPLKVERGQ